MINTKRFNVSKAGRKYQDAQGNEKTVWHNIGTLTEFHKEDGTISRLLEIPAIGLECNVFPFVDREDKQPRNNVRTQSYGNAPRAQEDTVEYPNDDINPEDIPF